MPFIPFFFFSSVLCNVEMSSCPYYVNQNNLAFWCARKFSSVILILLTLKFCFFSFCLYIIRDLLMLMALDQFHGGYSRIVVYFLDIMREQQNELEEPFSSSIRLIMY